MKRPVDSPRLAQDRVHHAARRRLAVRAGEVDRRVGPLRVARELHDGTDAVERRADVVLGRAGEDLLLDLAHPLHLLEVARCLEGGGVPAAVHAGLPRVELADHPHALGQARPRCLAVRLDEAVLRVEARRLLVALEVGQRDALVLALDRPRDDGLHRREPIPWPWCPGRT